jgi:hypothetical protein
MQVNSTQSLLRFYINDPEWLQALKVGLYCGMAIRSFAAIVDIVEA